MSLILDILFPKKCVGCRRENGYFCKDCVNNIMQTDLVCPKCEKQAVGGQTHPICKRKFGLDGLWSLGVYQTPLREAIQKLKYKRVKELVEILSDITIEYWAKYQPYVLDQIKKRRGEGWVVIPVPLHWFRQNDRGFNQSSEIARMIAQKLGLSYADALVRSRYTKSQMRLKSKQRKQNIKNAFSFSPNYDLRTMSSVLLIDDVWTTGSTLRECCFVLKRNGAKQVWALTLAR